MLAEPAPADMERLAAACWFEKMRQIGGRPSRRYAPMVSWTDGCSQVQEGVRPGGLAVLRIPWTPAPLRVSLLGGRLVSLHIYENVPTYVPQWVHGCARKPLAESRYIGLYG